MRLRCAIVALVLLPAVPAGAQGAGTPSAAPAAAAPAAGTPAAMPLTQALAPVQTEVANLIAAVKSLAPDGWKAPSEQKSSYDAAQASLERNLREAVPPLLAASQAAPADYGLAFRLYRDLDTVEAVVLSLNDAAAHDAPPSEAQTLDEACGGFNDALQLLGNAIETGASAQYARLRALQRQPAPKPAGGTPPPQTLVIKNANGTSSTAAKPKTPGTGH